MRNAGQKLTLNLRGEKLDKKDVFGTSDPFIRIHRPTRDGGLVMIAETEVIKQNLNPKWNPLVLALDALSRGDLDVPLLFEVFDWDKGNEDDYIGFFEASVNDLIKANATRTGFPIFDPASAAKKKGYTNSGVIFVSTA